MTSQASQSIREEATLNPGLLMQNPISQTNVERWISYAKHFFIRWHRFGISVASMKSPPFLTCRSSLRVRLQRERGGGERKVRLPFHRIISDHHHGITLIG